MLNHALSASLDVRDRLFAPKFSTVSPDFWKVEPSDRSLLTTDISTSNTGSASTPASFLEQEASAVQGDFAFSTPINVGTLKGTQTYSGTLGETNSSEFYRMSLATSGSINISLTGLTADLNLTLFADLNRNDIIDIDEEIQRSISAGSSDEAINIAGLIAGNYWLQVQQVTGSTAYTLRLSNSRINNLLPTEVNLGLLAPTNSVQHTGAIHKTNTADVCRITLNEESQLNLTLTDLTGDADLRLIHDRNNNGIVDNGEELARSQQSGFLNETIAINQLPAGTYFVLIYLYSGEAAYTLNISATSPASGDSAGNTLNTAQTINILTTPQTFNDFVGTADSNDFYHFTIHSSHAIDITLAGLTADADLELIRDVNNNGVIDRGEIIAYSLAPNATSERINVGLVAGTYYIRVYPYSGNTNYTLTISGSETSLNGYSSNYGYGMVDAASAVAAALAQAPFISVPDLGGNNWNLDQINAPEVWAQGYTGQNVIVAVIDSGVDQTHPDLAANIWRNAGEIPDNGLDDDGNGYIDDVSGWDFIDQDNTPTDRHGHGTHVAGTIAAVKNEFGITGVAYDARIMPIRVLDDEGYGTWSGIAAGIYYAVNKGANVINLSLGGSGYSPEIAAAVQYATEQGTVVVMASGNEGQYQPSFPANLAYQWGLAVGAVNHSNQVASFSNDAGFIPTNYIVAPGVDIYSTLPSNSYQSYTGTSMATPHVTGVAALILSANPTLRSAEVIDLLTKNARKTELVA